MISITHSTAEVGGFLDERFSWSRFLAGDLVEGEEEMMLLCNLRGKLNLYLFIEFWLPGRDREWEVGRREERERGDGKGGIEHMNANSGACELTRKWGRWMREGGERERGREGLSEGNKGGQREE